MGFFFGVFSGYVVGVVDGGDGEGREGLVGEGWLEEGSVCLGG